MFQPTCIRSEPKIVIHKNQLKIKIYDGIDNYLKIDSISVGSNAAWNNYFLINQVYIEFKMIVVHNVM